MHGWLMLEEFVLWLGYVYPPCQYLGSPGGTLERLEETKNTNYGLRV